MTASRSGFQPATTPATRRADIDLQRKTSALQDRVTALEAVTPWTALTFAASWGDFAAGWQVCQYRKIGDVVYLRGLATPTVANSTPITTLPTGYRPPATVLLGVQCSSGVRRVDINNAGVIIMSGATTLGDWASLNNISFSVTT